MNQDARIGVVGATGAVGTVTLRLLRERGYANVRAFASARSAGRELDGGLTVEEASADALLAGGLDLVLFSCGTSASRELVPDAVEGGALVVDKSSAYRLADGYPLVVPEVNGARALRGDRDDQGRRQPELLDDPAHVRPQAAARRGRAAERAGLDLPGRLGRGRAADGEAAGRADRAARPRVRLDVGGRRDRGGVEDPRRDAQDPRAARAAAQRDDRARSRPRRPCRSPSGSRRSSRSCPSMRKPCSPAPPASGSSRRRRRARPRRRRQVLVGRVRPDRAAEGNGLVLFLACDNLVKGAALNALQIAELLLDARARRRRPPSCARAVELRLQELDQCAHLASHIDEHSSRLRRNLPLRHRLLRPRAVVQRARGLTTTFVQMHRSSLVRRRPGRNRPGPQPDDTRPA